MSCQMINFAQFDDLKSVRKYLFPDDKGGSEEADDLGSWDDHDWGWKEDEAEEEKPEHDSLSWLQDSCTSISPTADIIAIGKSDRLVILSQKYGHDDDAGMKYSMTYEGVVCQEAGEILTSILCLPLASQKRSMQGGPDWTCVIVGYSTGYIRMFTENGTMLLSQIFSEEPVIRVKCRTYSPPRFFGGAEKHEELAILYKNSLVSVDGFSLFQSLRACRNQVARAAASGSEWTAPPPLSYKKWALTDQEVATDIALCGGVTPNQFNQMQTGAMIGGFGAYVKSTPPAQQLYIATGKNSFTSFFYILEGSIQPMLSDVAHAVASKLKSAFVNAASGWFGLSRQSDPAKEKKKAKIEAATSVNSRFGLPDKRRVGEAICLSPDGQLAGTADSFGRVMLIDVYRGIAVRMWKGYRDAQIGWVECREEVTVEGETNAPLRRVMFLIIYAPRRGILEVWTTQHGPRVAAFNTSRWCKLLCPSHGMLGLNSITYRTMRHPQFTLFLMDPAGSLQCIEIPFHVALSDKNSKRARDMHLLTKLKTALKEHNGSDVGALQGEVIDLLLDIRTVSIRQQGVDKILTTQGLSTSFLQTVLKAVINQLNVQQESAQSEAVTENEGQAELDYESRSLLQSSQMQSKLLETFASIQKLNNIPSMPPDKPAEEVAEEKKKRLQMILALSENELESMFDILNKYKCSAEPVEKHVKFEEVPITPQDFLQCFVYEVHKDPASSLTLQMQKRLPEQKMINLGSFLFDHVIQFGFNSAYHAVLQQGHLQAEDLMQVLLRLWLYSDDIQTDYVENVHSLVQAITALADTSLVTSDEGAESTWWKMVRTSLEQSQHLAASLLLALVARALAVDAEKIETKSIQPSEKSSEDSAAAATDQDERKSDDSDDGAGASEGWESVSLERAQWSMLVRQLEDLLIVQTLLNTLPPPPDVIPPWQSQTVLVSVAKVKDGGRGVLPEMLAKWISGHGITPTRLCPNLEEGREKKESDENVIVGGIEGIQARLPYTVDADILMANTSWEYMVLWHKDPEVVLSLELALQYMKCIQNTTLQLGVCVMIWDTFVSKKLHSAVLLVEKVGKCPKDRLCRRDVGLSEISLEKFLGHTVDLLEYIIQCSEHSREVPVYHVEVVWHEVPPQQSLVSLALEQKEVNVPLASHHHLLATLTHAVFLFGLRGLKPLSLFDTRGKNAFFKKLHTYPVMPTPAVDQALINERFKILCLIITHSVQTIGEAPSGPTMSPTSSPSVNLLSAHGPLARFIKWPDISLRMAAPLGVSPDELRIYHCLELYSYGLDQLGYEILLTVSNNVELGCRLAVLAGKRLHYFVYEADIDNIVKKVAYATTELTGYLKALNPNTLKCLTPTLSDTSKLLGQIVNLLPESFPEYRLVIQMIDFIQNFQ